jgi:hypothetical protein
VLVFFINNIYNALKSTFIALITPKITIGHNIKVLKSLHLKFDYSSLKGQKPQIHS